MSDTLDGMTVEQLDELIARAQKTRERVKETSAWRDLPVINDTVARVNIETKAIQYREYGDWHVLGMHTDALLAVCSKLGSSNDRRRVAAALVILADEVQK